MVLVIDELSLCESCGMVVSLVSQTFLKKIEWHETKWLYDIG